jgi:hypothetical protein
LVRASHGWIALHQTKRDIAPQAGLICKLGGSQTRLFIPESKKELSMPFFKAAGDK